MAARAVITMSPEQYLAGLKQLEASTTKSASKMENSFKEYGTSINKAGIAMRYVSAEMGAGAVAFGRAFQVLAGGKIAIAVAAVAGAFVGLKKIWDEQTVSSDELKMKLDSQIKSSEKNLDVIRKTQSEEDSMIERLSELAKRENKTNEETTEQVKLAEILAGRYSKLGIGINDLTGDYKSLMDAVQKLNAAQNKQREGALEDQVKARKQLIQTQFEENIDPGFLGGLWNMVKFDSGKTTEMQAADFRSLLPKQQRDFIAQKRDAATTVEEIQKWASMLDLIDKQIDDMDRLNNLKKTGSETTKEQTAELEKHSEASRKAADEEESAHQKRVAELEAEMKLQEELDKKASEAAQKRLEEEEKLKRAAEQRRTDALANLKFSFMRLTGQSEKAAISEAIYNESKAQGQILDEATVKDITKRTKAQLALQRLQGVQTASPELYAPRVNSLIARGGSAAPMKLPKVEEYQAKTLNSVDKIARDMNLVKNYLSEYGLI